MGLFWGLWRTNLRQPIIAIHGQGVQLKPRAKWGSTRGPIMGSRGVPIVIAEAGPLGSMGSSIQFVGSCLCISELAQAHHQAYRGSFF